MKSKIPFSGMRAKNIAKTQPLSPCWDRKKTKSLDLTERGKSDDIAHSSIIQVSTVYRCRWLVSTPGLGIIPRPNNGIRTFKSAMSIMSGNGWYKLRNSENGVDRVRRSRMITRFYFALEIRGSARHLSGNKDYSPAGEERQLRWQLAGSRSAVRLSQRKKHSCRVFLLWVPWAKGAVCAGLLSEQIASRMERIPGSRTEKGRWWLWPATRSILYSASTALC